MCRALGRLLEQQRDDIASLRDVTAIIQRLDNSHTRLLSEIRATHAQVSRLAEWQFGQPPGREIAAPDIAGDTLRLMPTVEASG